MRIALMGSGLWFALAFAACGSDSKETDTRQPGPANVVGWTPLAPTDLPATCGGLLDTSTAPPHPSSLRKDGSCDFGEIVDSVHSDFQCPGDGPCDAQQPAGDQLCHRLCDDNRCADGETCQERTTYVSDTPSKYAKLCMCASGACVEKPPAPSPAAGGIEAWRDETPMPSDRYYHAAAADDRHLFIAGGLKVKERQLNGATLETVAEISVADLDPTTGAVGAFRQAGTLTGAVVHHAMAVLGSRLYVAGGESPTNSRAYVDDVVSYPINADGTLGALRTETKLPAPRGSHSLIVDGRRLIVAAGANDANFSDGTRSISFADVNADGVVGPWSSVDAPTPSYRNGAGVVGGTLFLFNTGEYLDRSTRALYGIRLSSLVPNAPASAFVRNAAWPYDPSALSAVNEDIAFAGSCDAFVLVGEHGAVATAPVDGAGHVGAFAAAARFEGTNKSWAVATSPSGRIYVTGGTADTNADGARIRSTRRLH